MPHYKSFYDYKYVAAHDLDGKEKVLEIAKVCGESLQSERGTDKCLVLYFKGAKKGFVVNKTNAKTIARMYGTDTNTWVGKPITMYPTTTMSFGEEVDCLRVRPTVPK